MKPFPVLIFFSLLFLTSPKSAEEWKSRIIYELLTDRFARLNNDPSSCQDLQKYCGGTLNGIRNNLDYIMGLGCNAIWISPIVANIEGGYHGYWTRDFYQVNENFGTEQDLKDLIRACHEREIWVMVDVIVNHVGYVDNHDFSKVVPFSDPSHYHEDIGCDTIDPDDQEGQEKCWLHGLPDLDQDNEFVRKTLLEWVSELVKKYEIDGLRLDALKHVPKTFWSEFSKASGVFTLGENFDKEVSLLKPYQGPVDSLLNFPLQTKLQYVFHEGGSMNIIRNYYEEEAKGWRDTTVLVNFLSNHDLPRFLHQNNNVPGFKSAIAFILCSVGIPSIYYGDEQGFGGGPDPQNREPLWTNMNRDSEFYKFIQTITKFRKETSFYNEEQIQRYVDDNFYAFSRGYFMFAFTNLHDAQERTIDFHPYHENTKVCNVFYPEDCVEVKDGKFLIILNGGEFKILAPQMNQEEEPQANKSPILEKGNLIGNVKDLSHI